MYRSPSQYSHAEGVGGAASGALLRDCGDRSALKRVRLPLLAEAMDSGSNPPGVASGWTAFFAVLYVAPFGLISFLLAIFAKLAQKLDENEQGL